MKTEKSERSCESLYALKTEINCGTVTISNHKQSLHDR